jgi:hypothetical protein
VSALSTLNLLVDVSAPDRQGLLSLFSSSGRGSISTLIRNDGMPVTLRCVQPNASGARLWDDIDLEDARAAGGIRLAIGQADLAPVAGTFGIAYDGSSTGLAALDWDITADELKTALNANAAITSDGGIATVTKEANFFRITFSTVGAKDNFTQVANGLQPSSYIRLAQLIAGDSTTNEVWIVELKQNPYALIDSWTSGPGPSVTVATVQAGGTGNNEVQTITLAAGTYAGTYSLTVVIGGSPVSRTFVVPVTATAAELQTIIEAHPSIGSGKVSVTGSASLAYQVEFIGGLADTNITQMTAVDIDMLAPKTVTGTLRLNGDGLYRAFLESGSDTLSPRLELQITFPDEDPATVLQTQVTVSKDIIDLDALLSTLSPNYPTPGQIVRYLSATTGYTGGTSSDLDSVVTVGRALGLHVFKHSGGELKFFRLEAGTDAESSPNVIRPDDYHASTNAVVWKLQSVGAGGGSGSSSYEAATAISSAGNTALVPTSMSHTADVTLNGSGTFTATVALPTSGRTTGDKVFVTAAISSGVNRTLEIHNATSGGTLLASALSQVAAAKWCGDFTFNGTAWVAGRTGFVA